MWYFQKPDPKSQYYAISTIKCKKNPDFIQIIEGSTVCIEDFDNLDYWISNNEDLVQIVPKCCVSTSPGGIKMSQNLTRKRNTRETFREDILQISNKTQESIMKRK